MSDLDKRLEELERRLKELEKRDLPTIWPLFDDTCPPGVPCIRPHQPGTADPLPWRGSNISTAMLQLPRGTY